MSLAKLSIGGALNAMKTEEGNESPDSLIKLVVQKEPLLSFSKTGDSPVQWIQLFQALDQPGLPGWPPLTHLKVTMKKCEKCSQGFCSPVNYRRHIRVHRRSLNVNKESHKTKDLLAAFWDKLSVEEAREVLSLKDASLKEVHSSSVIGALASSLRQPGVWALPQVYVRAGSTLLDIIQANTSRLPISSQELFSILDDASENTFLCAGTAESLQKYVFDKETAKHSLKLTNLIACTTFLFEQQLVKAWVNDKDAEALRCQKLLVEEEEAAQRRQAELLERKKLKKLRQKEQKKKDQLNGLQALKPEPLEKLTPPKTKKSNVDSEESKPRLQGETSNHPTEQNSFELMIGSISVTLRDPDEVKDTCCTKHAIPEKSDILEKPVKHSFSMNRHGTSGIWSVDKGGEESGGSVLDEAGNQTVCSERCTRSCSVDSDDQDGGKHSVMFSDGNAKEGGLRSWSIAAKEFFAERWKKAIASNHWKLALLSELEGSEDNCSMAAQTSNLPVNGNTEKQLVGLEASSGNAQF